MPLLIIRLHQKTKDDIHLRLKLLIEKDVK